MAIHKHIRTVATRALVAAAVALLPVTASGQPLGTFKWQLQSFCNVISLSVTQTAGVFTLDGFDDQCGASTRAPVTGLATFNPNGTVEFGLTIVMTPQAAPVHVAAAISIATLSGTWRDSSGATGNFVFTPGSGTGGSPRPLPTTTEIPDLFTFRTDGGFLGEGTFGAGAIPDSGSGTRMMWYPRKAAFRAGRVDADAWDDANIGSESVAFNKNTRATATFSAAFGDSTLASGPVSTAMGFFTTASGNASTAMGSNTTASGPASTALGSGTVASGSRALAAGLDSTASSTAAFAMGDQVVASGLTSVALGFHAQTPGHGSFAFADRSTTTAFVAFDNQFGVRAIGGSGFYTNATLTAGVELAPNGSSWSSVSDVNMKENFRDLDDGDLLAKIAQMPVREWNYKAQGAAIRHMGPTAQDFHAAFGLGENPLRISTIDADGVALAGVKALEARTRAINETLVRENETLKAELAALRERLEQIETRLPR